MGAGAHRLQLLCNCHALQPHPPCSCWARVVAGVPVLVAQAHSLLLTTSCRFLQASPPTLRISITTRWNCTRMAAQGGLCVRWLSKHCRS